MIRLFIISLFFFSPSYVAAGVGAGQKSDMLEVTEAELKDRVGRIGEVETVPEDFTFSEAENRLWLSDHLRNITEPTRLYYEFTKVGSHEEGFVDAVYLDILELNDDGTKKTALEFFTGERQQAVHEHNVQNVVGNPVLGIYLQGDVYEMQRLTGGHWRHFHKQIKVALRETATVQPVVIEFNGKKVDAVKISFAPYVKDPHRAEFEQLADKLYEITLADQVPGTLYKIRTVILDKGNGTAALMEEILTLISTKKR